MPGLEKENLDRAFRKIQFLNRLFVWVKCCSTAQWTLVLWKSNTPLTERWVFLKGHEHATSSRPHVKGSFHTHLSGAAVAIATWMQPSRIRHSG